MKPIVLMFLLAMAVMPAAPQTAEQKPSFEVASVKPNDSGSRASSSSTMPGGGFRATNLSLRLLILSAYRLKGFQLIGGPEWLDTARFDIGARAPENTTQTQTLLMLRTLLEERFKFTAHSETKEQP